jgi:hypothetical protein
MKAVAIKKGQGQAKAAGFQEMGTLRCDGCGDEFFIAHDPAFVDKWLAAQIKTAVWAMLVACRSEFVTADAAQRRC